MSQINQISEKENKGNSSINQKKILNFTFKEKDEEKKSDNSSFNNKDNNNKIQNEEINNEISLSNNKEMIYSQSNSIIKESENNNNNSKSKDLNNLELNYIEMSKQLEELRHESSFLKNKLREISNKQKNFNKNNKNVGNTISFNKATFINIKKLKNIRYDDSWNKNHKTNNIEINNTNNNNNKIIPNSRNLKKVKSSSKIKLPLFKSFYENSSNKKNNQLNINKTFINDIKNKILYTDENYINDNKTSNNFLSLKLNNEKPTKLFPSNNLLFTHLESKKDSYLVNQLSDKNKLINKLNNNLVERNKLAEGKISLLIKDKNKINEKLNFIQKEKDEYKKKKESEIKQYMRDLKSDNKIIKELFNEKHKLLKSKRESELLNQKLKNIILEKRNELKGFYKPKKLSYDYNYDSINNKGNSYIKNIKQKYIDINNENKEIKNQILSLKKKLGMNQKKELDMKKYMHNIYTYSSSKKLNKPNNIKLILTDKKEDLENNKNNSNDDIDGSFNFENNNTEENENPFKKKYHSENTNISNNDTININNEEIKIFSKYINIIQENKANQEKLSEIQNELNIKNETIKNLEKKLKEDLVSKETLIENMKKEKSELQKLLNIEKQKTLKLKLFAEEEQKKHIKYKNKLEKYKKSKTEEKKIEKPEAKEIKNPNPDLDFFIYSNSPMFDENKSIAKLKEDILKLKQLLDKEKNKNEILQILSENEKEKHDLVKNKYNKTKKLNITLINKIKEKEFSLNNEIKIENEALKKQLIDTENKNEELKQIIQKLNEEINSYKNNDNNEIKVNKENKEINESNEYNIAINPINEIRDEKFKSEKKNNDLLFQKKFTFQDKKNQRFSAQMNKQTFSQAISQIPIEKNIIPKSNKDLLQSHFKKGKLLNSTLKNQKNLSIRNPSNKTSQGLFLKEFSVSAVNLELNNSDINKEKEHSDLDLEIKMNTNKKKRREKRENSEKVIRIFNGNNISSSEFSSEKNFSENNKGTQIDNVIKENENEDDDEKFNSEISGKKGNNNINDNNNDN